MLDGVSDGGRGAEGPPRSSRWSSRKRLTAAAITAVLVVGVVVFTQHQTPKPPPPPAALQPPKPRPVTLPAAPVTTAPVGLVAALRATTPSFVSPGGLAGKPILATWHGSALFLPVVAIRSGDLEVRLPTRPNGSTAWIAEAGIHLSRTPYRIVIDLATRHLLLYRDGVVVVDAPAGVGTATDPTPIGHFFVASFATAPSSAWGPFVIVTSAHSNAITDWEESGDAVVAIHGPLGEDAAIGTSGAQISHGCVRLHLSALSELRVVPDGSPIDVIA
ncbi:MAG TPA: L,D-transpeptidase [Acidimicrobiales bacterium]